MRPQAATAIPPLSKYEIGPEAGKPPLSYGARSLLNTDPWYSKVYLTSG